MSKVFNQTIMDIAELSGCDWDFVANMHNYLWDKHRDFNMARFTIGVLTYDWNTRQEGRYGGRFENVLIDLCERSGYTYDYLFKLLADIIYDPDDSSDWDYFVGVTMEHDW